MLAQGFPSRAILASLFLATRTDPLGRAGAGTKILHLGNRETFVAGNHHDARAFEDLAEFLDQFLFLGSIHSFTPSVGGVHPPAHVCRMSPAFRSVVRGCAKPPEESLGQSCRIPVSGRRLRRERHPPSWTKRKTAHDELRAGSRESLLFSNRPVAKGRTSYPVRPPPCSLNRVTRSPAAPATEEPRPSSPARRGRRGRSRPDEQPDAAGGDGLAQVLGFAAAVDAVERVLAVLEEVERAGAERVAGAGIHTAVVDGVGLELRMAQRHLVRHLPARPLAAVLVAAPRRTRKRRRGRYPRRSAAPMPSSWPGRGSRRPGRR